MKKNRIVARNACLAFVVHGCLAVGVLALERAPGGANIYGWDAYRLFRAVEYPVLWVIDGILERFLILPARWFPNFESASSLNLALAYVLVGGAFYAALAASATLLLRTRPPKTIATENLTETPSRG